MAELIREIESQDLPKVAQLLKQVFGNEEYVDIQRLGGMTNHSYRVEREDGKVYLVRIPGDGTEELVNRLDERKSTELACGLGIDSELLFFGDDGRKVMRFLDAPQEMNADVMKRDENMRQAADIFRKLHQSGTDTGVRFEVFEMAAAYENLIRSANVALYPDYEAVKGEVMRIKAEVDAELPPERVPCHNDSLLGNWVLDCHGMLWLIDWEYSGMNDGMWDLSCTSIECDYSKEDDERLLRYYYGGGFDQNQWKKFMASKLYVDYLWTLWGLTRVPYDGEFMQEYADERYSRLKQNLKEITA